MRKEIELSLWKEFCDTNMTINKTNTIHELGLSLPTQSSMLITDIVSLRVNVALAPVHCVNVQGR